MLIISLVTVLMGCAGVDKTLYIDDGRWILKSAYHIKEQNIMTLVACEQGYTVTEADTAAEVVSCALVAKGGELVIEDSTSGKSYVGEYGKPDAYGGTVAYAVFVYESSGAAVIGKTTYADGSEETTLTLHLGYYLLNFYKE